MGFAKFLEIIVTHKLVGMVIARLRAIIVRRIRANLATESQEQSRLSTAHLGTQNRFLQEMNEYNSVKIKAAQKAFFEGLTLRPWQQEILNIVSRSPILGDRTIHIVVDACGNSGKSLVSSLVSTLHGMQCLGIGKRDDILYAFRQACPSFTGVRGVVIDTPMSAGTTGHDSRISVWQAAELLKGFQLVINKYASVIRSLPPLHVVIMTNQPVPPGVFGEKRARIHDLKHTDLGITMTSSWYDHTATTTPLAPTQ